MNTNEIGTGRVQDMCPGCGDYSPRCVRCEACARGIVATAAFLNHAVTGTESELLDFARVMTRPAADGGTEIFIDLAGDRTVSITLGRAAARALVTAITGDLAVTTGEEQCLIYGCTEPSASPGSPDLCESHGAAMAHEVAAERGAAAAAKWGG